MAVFLLDAELACIVIDQEEPAALTLRPPRHKVTEGEGASSRHVQHHTCALRLAAKPVAKLRVWERV